MGMVLLLSLVVLSHRGAPSFTAVEPGHTLLLDDGKLRMRVKDSSAERIVAEVMVGGPLASRKGISLPDTLLPVSPLTEKDHRDLQFLLGLFRQQTKQATIVPT